MFLSPACVPIRLVTSDDLLWLNQHVAVAAATSGWVIKQPSCGVGDLISLYASYERQADLLVVNSRSQIPSGITDCHHLNPNQERWSQFTHPYPDSPKKSGLHRPHCCYQTPSYTLKQRSGVILMRSHVILWGVRIPRDCRCSGCDQRDPADKHQWWQMSTRGENFANPHFIWLGSFSNLFSWC